MFPLGDDNSDRRITPVVNYVLIALNIFVFVFLQGLDSTNAFTMAFVTVPEEREGVWRMGLTSEDSWQGSCSSG
jgi:membrane associated rhomboid family serine protease